MPDVTQYEFQLREVCEALVARQGLKEGRWMLAFEFGIGAGNIGTGPGDFKPAAFIPVLNVKLVRAGEDLSNEILYIVDAKSLTEKKRSGGWPEKSGTAGSSTKPIEAKAPTEKGRVRNRREIVKSAGAAAKPKKATKQP